MSTDPISKSPILKVAVNVPLSREFDYLPPKSGQMPMPGCRVRVPFGKRHAVGLVLGHEDSSSLPPHKLRHASALVDESPILAETDLKLIRFCSDYYHHPIGEVVAAALPALLRQGRPLNPRIETIAVTAAMPMTTPRIVSAARIRFLASDRSAMLTVFQNPMLPVLSPA